MKTLQMQSCVHENGTVECALKEVEVPSPSGDEVLVEIDAAPINPSDLGLMFGAADPSSAQETERDGQPAIHRRHGPRDFLQAATGEPRQGVHHCPDRG